MSARVIVLAGGEGERWGNHRGSPKHLVSIEGEALLHRTCRQFLKYTNDVIIVGPDDDGYRVDGTALYTPNPPKTRWRDMAKFWSCHELWSPRRTVLAFGDVYFTNEAVSQIMENTSPWMFFLRKGPSSLTGCEYREIFAFAFDGSEQGRIRMKITDIINRHAPKSAGGWALFRELVFDTHNYLFDNPFYVNIDDWTEDFDFPQDLEKWEMRRGWAKIGAAENSDLSPSTAVPTAEPSAPSARQSRPRGKASPRQPAES